MGLRLTLAVLFLVYAAFVVAGIADEGIDTNAGSGTCNPDEGDCTDADANDIDDPANKIHKDANADGRPPEVSFDNCIDRHESCPYWAEIGECEKNPGWMIVKCSKSCEACHLRDPQVRCQRTQLNISTSPIYAPGDMNSMFSSIESTFGDRYGVTVLSTDPWVVTFDNFVTDEEADALISTNSHTFERSTDTGKANAYGEQGRILSTG
jgi:hypothetical protein